MRLQKRLSAIALCVVLVLVSSNGSASTPGYLGKDITQAQSAKSGSKALRLTAPIGRDSLPGRELSNYAECVMDRAQEASDPLSAESTCEREEHAAALRHALDWETLHDDIREASRGGDASVNERGPGDR